MARLTLILAVLTAVIALLGWFRYIMDTIQDMRLRKKNTGKWLLCATLFLIPVSSEAACSGSGLTWTCPAGETQANIQSALASASDGATITLAAGSYSFRRVRLDQNGDKGVTIICATAPLTRGAATSSPCTLSDDQPFWTSGSGTITKKIRVSGFRFTNSSGGPNFSYGFNSGDAALSQIRIDHNTFLAQSGHTIAFGYQSAVASKWGVIDHNRFQDTSGGSAQMIFYGAGDTDWGLGIMAGTANAVYIEDNDFAYTTERLAGSGGDGSNGGAQVWRYNTIANSRPAVHGRCHNGPVNFEVYNNTIDSSSGYRIVHHQGCGEMIVFGNTITPNDSSMALQHYRSSSPNPEGCGTCDGTQGGDGNRAPTGTYRGYPCAKQPARTGGGVYRPVYVWNNRYGNGDLIQLNIESAGGTSYLAEHMVAGRDHFQASTLTTQTSASSPFSGTIASNGGMGYGTLANRPTTCETSSETSFGNGAAGAGYFATDSGSQGTLYTCSATNTWSVYYTPYTYPHPLIDGEAPPADTASIILFLEWSIILSSVLWHMREAAINKRLPYQKVAESAYHVAIPHVAKAYYAARHSAAKAIVGSSQSVVLVASILKKGRNTHGHR